MIDDITQSYIRSENKMFPRNEQRYGFSQIFIHTLKQMFVSAAINYRYHVNNHNWSVLLVNKLGI